MQLGDFENHPIHDIVKGCFLSPFSSDDVDPATEFVGVFV